MVTKLEVKIVSAVKDKDYQQEELEKQKFLPDIIFKPLKTLWNYLNDHIKNRWGNYSNSFGFSTLLLMNTR